MIFSNDDLDEVLDVIDEILENQKSLSKNDIIQKLEEVRNSVLEIEDFCI